MEKDLDLYKYESFLNERKLNYLNVNYEIVSNYLEYLNSLKLSSSTIRRNISSIRNYYHYLIRQHKISSNPFNLISNPLFPIIICIHCKVNKTIAVLKDK